MPKQFVKPDAGRNLRVVTAWHDDIVARQLGHELHEHKGVVLPSEEFDPPNTFLLQTNVPRYPVSIIALERVVVLEPYDGKEDIRQIEVAPAPLAVQERLVAGSKPGSFYKVSFADGGWICTSAETKETCKGLSFNRMCRHIESVKTQEGM